MSRLTRDGTAEPVSRDKFSGASGDRGILFYFPCSADHEQDWEPYPVDPFCCYMCDHADIEHKRSFPLAITARSVGTKKYGKTRPPQGPAALLPRARRWRALLRCGLRRCIFRVMGETPYSLHV